jgi:hypothetical protein
MASKTETGHAKNTANFEKLIAACKSYGAKYNPSNTEITLAELQKILDNANTALKTVKTTKAPFDNAVNARQIAFEPLSKLTTRVISSLAATKATEQVVKDAKTVGRKLQGRRAVAIKEEGLPANREAGDPIPGIDVALEQEVRHISTSQMSYDSRIDNLEKLITVLSAEALYQPNEADLKTQSLTDLLTNLRKLNTDVINTSNPYSNSVIERNKVLYAENTGLVDNAFEVKKYVISVFGTTAPEYKKISKLKFTRPRK